MKYFIYNRKSQEAEDRQMMSLESQAAENQQLAAQATDITIVDSFSEACSAKAPGRPVFNAMLDRVEAGEADGIIAWHPDRLARNSMDGGRIIYLLDQGKLKDLRFGTYTFENTSQGKFMLNIVFGYSKYYVDSLSENVKRGQRAKIRHGWQPNLAPIGYRNCKETSTIVPDPEHFDAIRRMFDLLLTGQHSVQEIHRIVCDEWGYRTPIIKTRGGKPLNRATLYRIFSNPFYAGRFRWGGQLYDGNHQPMITLAEYKRVERLIEQRSQPRPQRLSFAYGGLLTCGTCGLAVTAEHKRKPSGRTYTYYHCTRRHRQPYCQQPSIEERQLDEQACRFIDQLGIVAPVIEWFIEQIATRGDDRKQSNAKLVGQHDRNIADLTRQRSNLIDLRTREVVGDEEFNNKRTKLDLAIATAEENRQKAANPTREFEPLLVLQILRNKAADWFKAIEPALKRDLLRILCSHPTLKDKVALFEAKKPFVELDKIATCLNLQGDGDDVRTNEPVVQRLTELATDPRIMALAQEARAFIERVEPEALAALGAPRASDQRSAPTRCKRRADRSLSRELLR